MQRSLWKGGVLIPRFDYRGNEKLVVGLQPYYLQNALAHIPYRHNTNATCLLTTTCYFRDLSFGQLSVARLTWLDPNS